MAKTSALPKSPRSVLNVYALLASLPAEFSWTSDAFECLEYDDCFLSEGTYQSQRLNLTRHETIVLRTIGFQLHVSLPYTLCINYLQALDAFKSSEQGQKIAKRAFEHLNSALLSPQLLYLTHQPPSLATAAIYLAARETAVKLPEHEWWEIFDCDREELGFLVVAMISMDGFVKEEKSKWQNRRVPITVEEVNTFLDE